MSWKEILHEEVNDCIETLHDMALDSDEYNKAVPKVNAMIDRLNEAEKLEIERTKLEADKLNKERELEIERTKLEADKRDRLIKNILTGLTFVGSAAVTIWGTMYSDRFDADKIRGNEAGKTHIRNWVGFMKRH